MISMIHSLNTLHRNQAILCDYHAKNVTHWSEHKQFESQQSVNTEWEEKHLFEDKLNEEADHHIEMCLCDKKQWK